MVDASNGNSPKALSRWLKSSPPVSAILDDQDKLVTCPLAMGSLIRDAWHDFLVPSAASGSPMDQSSIESMVIGMDRLDVVPPELDGPTLQRAAWSRATSAAGAPRNCLVLVCSCDEHG